MTGSRPVTPRVLILGWGFLGGAIGEQLLADGMTVSGQLVRRPGGLRPLVVLVRASLWGTRIRSRRSTVPCVTSITSCTRSVVTRPAVPQRIHLRTLAMLLPLIAVLEALRERPPRHSHLHVVGWCHLWRSRTASGPRNRRRTTNFTLWSITSRAEGYAQMSARRCGSRLQIVRCSNIYGPHQPHGRDQGVVAIFLDRISKGDPLRIFGDGSALLDYVFVGDVAVAVSRIIAGQIDTGTINIGSGVGLTVLEIAHAISAETGKAAIIEHQPERSFDIRSSVLDISRARSLLDYSPRDFAYGLTATVAAYLQGARGQSLDQRTLVSR